jgi:hypothetical protein
LEEGTEWVKELSSINPSMKDEDYVILNHEVKGVGVWISGYMNYKGKGFQLRSPISHDFTPEQDARISAVINKARQENIDKLVNNFKTSSYERLIGL